MRSRIMRRRAMVLAGAVGVVAGFSKPQAAVGATVTFSSANAEWLTGGNWTPSSPGTGDTASVDSGTVDMSITAGSMSIGAISYTNTLNRLLGNATGDGTNSNLTLNGSGASPLILVTTTGGTPATFTIKGANNGAGTGTLGLTLNASGSFSVVPALSLLDISAAIGETGGARALTKSGNGLLSLSAANSYSGVTTVNAGTMRLSGSSGAITSSTVISLAGGTLRLDNSSGNNNDRIGNSAAITMDAGTLEFDGNRDAPTLESAGAMTISGGQNTVGATATTGSASSASITLVSLSRSGGAVNFADSGSEVSIGLASSPTLSNGILGGWATFNGADWATYDGDSGSIVAYTAYTTASDTTTWTSTQNIDADGDRTVSLNTSVHSLRVSNASTPSTITVDPGVTLNVSNGILATGVSGHAISGSGSLTAGSAAGAEMIVQVQDATDTLTIATPIVNNGGGSINVVKAGPGRLVIDGASTYGGNTEVLSGTVQLGSSGSIVNSTVNLLAAGTLDVNGLTKTIGGLSGSGPVTLGAGALSIGNNNGSTTYTGAISGTGGSITKVGSGTLLLSGSIANTHTGGNTVNAGTLSVDTETKFGAIPGVPAVNINLNAATLRINNTLTVNINRQMTLGASSSTIDIPSGISVSFPGVISGSGTLNKIGAGTLDLRTAINTYTGGVYIDDGTLAITREQTTGATPTGGVDPDFVTIDGATLRWYSSGVAGNLDMPVNKGVYLTASGGTIDWSQSSGTPSTAYSISGPGKLTKLGARTVLANVAHPFGGGFDIKQGRWNTQVNGSAGTSTITLAALTGDVAQLGIGGTNVGATVTLTNDIVLAPVGTGVNSFEVNNSSPTQNTLNLNGNISGTGGLTKGNVAGTTGNLALGGNNTYSGDTTIKLGTLFVSGGSAIPDTSMVVMLGAAGVKFDCQSSTETIGGLSGGSATGGFVVLGSGALTISQGATTTYAGVISGTGGSIAKAGTGVLTLTGTHTYTGSTSASAGRLVLGQSLTTSSAVSASGTGTIELQSNGSYMRVIKAASVTTSGSGKIDIRDNKLITQSAIGTHNGSNYTGVTGLLESGRNGGVWDGAGLTTSMPDATTGSGYTMLGVATGSEARGIGATDTDTWGGVTVTGSSTLVMYTYGGDANLSGNVDIDDYGQIDFNASTGGVLTGWYNGDFDYNGIQDIDDYGVIDFVVGIQGAPFPTASGGGMSIAVVPEPVSGLTLLVGGIGWFGARRRRFLPRKG